MMHTNAPHINVQMHTNTHLTYTHVHKHTNKISEHVPRYTGWAGETAQRLRALAALAEDLSLIPSTHMVAHNHL